MGGTISRFFGVSEGFYKRKPWLVKMKDVFEALGLDEHDVHSLHRVFKKVLKLSALTKDNEEKMKPRSIDEKCMTVRIGDLLIHFDFERTTFNNTIFGMFSRREIRQGRAAAVKEEPSGTGLKVSFFEFVLSLYNFCSIPMIAIPSFIFDLYDYDESGALDTQEVMCMLNHFFGDQFLNNQQCSNMYHSMQKMMAVSSVLVIEQFLEICCIYPTLLSSVYQLQLALMKGTLGFARWEKIGTKRGSFSKTEGVFMSTRAILASESINLNDYEHRRSTQKNKDNQKQDGQGRAMQPHEKSKENVLEKKISQYQISPATLTKPQSIPHGAPSSKIAPLRRKRSMSASDINSMLSSANQTSQVAHNTRSLRPQEI